MAIGPETVQGVPGDPVGENLALKVLIARDEMSMSVENAGALSTMGSDR
jgi:hypothetical protein